MRNGCLPEESEINITGAATQSVIKCCIIIVSICFTATIPTMMITRPMGVTIFLLIRISVVVLGLRCTRIARLGGMWLRAGIAGIVMYCALLHT